MGADTEGAKLGGSNCGFEGVEKRLEVEFAAKGGTVIIKGGNYGGLRSLSRCQLDEMLTAAGCTIVSELHNKWFDAYVLSESSLFVYPHRIVLKTCGRTQLLTSIPLLLTYAAGLSLDASRCKYSRGTFIFPHAQPFPYTSFAEETRFLDRFFGKLGAGSKSHVLDGHPSGSRSWHIYTAASEAETSDTTYTLEMCMTQLDSAVAAHFLNDSGTKSGSDMTEQSGIALILPSAHISDFAFTPCGYSMNGMEEGALSTIHITPEESHSYASFEAMGYDPHLLDLQALVNCVVSCFKPGSLVMSVHVCGYGEGKLARPSSWSTSYVVPLGYACNSSIRQELPGHSVVTYHTFRKSSPCSKSTVTPQPLISHNNWVKPNTPFYSSIQPTVHDDQGLMTLLQQEGNMFELEDNRIGISTNGANDAAFYTGFHELTTRQASNVASYTRPYEYTRKASDLALYRDSYEDLIAHDQLTSSYELISHGGTLLTLIDSDGPLPIADVLP